MAETIRVSIRPEVFRWLRTSAGWSVEDVSRRLRTSVEVVEAIEAGKRDPTLRQLKELSLAYKRPLALFLLSKPLPEPPKPKDFRMLPDKKNVFDKKTILALRKARELQRQSAELSENIKYSVTPKITKANIDDEPEQLARKYRELLELTEEKQRRFKDAYKLFNYLRDRLEDLNIMVFQFSMPVEDARGFALTDRVPNVIVINSKDSIEARLFTLMHEFGHILLGQTVIDIPDIQTIHSVTMDRVEHWCNVFSSHFLLPRELAMSIFKEEKRPLVDSRTLSSLKSRYKVSKAMLLYNMFKLNFITQTEYEEVLGRYRPQEPKAEEKKKKQGGGIPVDRKRLLEMGEKFISIVANNYDKDYITYTDALGYLSVKSKNFDKVIAQARK